jgi:phospholipid-binding lipoprotein MlaA
VTSGASNLAQGKFKNAATNVGRVFINTVFGMFGMVDWASNIGLEKPATEDVGQALGRWGVGTGPYLMLPLYGPSTLRDVSDPIFDWVVWPSGQIRDNTAGSITFTVMRGLDARARLLPLDKVLEDGMIFDQYSYIRDSYLQSRYNAVHDGQPPKPLVLGPTDDDDDDETPIATTTPPVAGDHE